MSTVRAEREEAAAPPPPPALSTPELARWAWRQLTSMRVALLLLFLLALATVPGSVVPQRTVNPLAVTDFREANPTLSEWYDRLGLFDVYAAPWFAAIYLALLVSLVGCILPRSRQHWRAVRARPPAAPRNLSRLPEHRRFEVPAPADAVLAAAHATLRDRRYRVAADGASLAAERGHLRETGNLVFHLAVVVVLLAVALGSLFGYRATVLVPEGRGFANSVIQFDSLESGSLFDPTDLPPFSLELEEFVMDFVDEGPAAGTPREYAATVSLTREPGAEPETRTIRVNEPLSVGGTLVHVLNPGYAPVVTVRDADGEVLFTGPAPFLPQDDTFASTGVVKVPVPPGRGLGEDLGIEGIFLPTAVLDAGGPRSVFPEPRNPALFLTAYRGDLGLDDGVPQSVYRLDTDAMQQFVGEDGTAFRAGLSVGESVDLPDGYGSVTLDGYVPWVNFQVGRNAGKELALVGALLALAGLMASMFVRRRRAWVRVVAAAPGRTVVEAAGLDRSQTDQGGDLASEVDALIDGVRQRLGAGGPAGGDREDGR
ncbi:MAG TPA: cytochrome c biogenesis protein ResB [Jiangellales bacterium]|nr:cytochrome c biogenesis protein ResB [Jiangellales bacterium]